MQLLTAKFNQIATEIESTNAQITALQTKLGELQEFQQQLLSVEQAVQSALSQTDTALMMLTHVDPSQIEVFKDALTVKFTSETIGIIEPAAPPAPETAPQPDPTTPAPETVIDVEVTPETTAEPTTATEPDIEQELNKLPLPLLRTLAKSKSVDARGSAANITARLKKIVTNIDIRALA